MPFKQIITVVLILFVGAGVLFMLVGIRKETGQPEKGINAWGEDRSEGRLESHETGSSEGISGHSVVAYYFYGTKRCPTCIKIEKYARESITDGFPELIESGRLQFRAINVDETENGHFINDYKLTTKSVIISDRLDGKETRWKNLDLVWEYVGEKETFIDYVKRETSDYLGELKHE